MEWPDAVYDKVGNILLSRIMGADVRLDPSGFDIGIRQELGGRTRIGRGERRQALRDSGRRLRPPARRARVRALGRRGGRAGARVRRLLRHVVVCSVTGSTQAGMVAGFAAQETDRAVLGIDGSATVAQTWAQIARIARATAEAIELGRELDDSEIVLLDEWQRARTASPTRRRSTPFACAPASKVCSPIPSTRASRWPR